MPTYDYRCNECSEAFVVIHSIKDRATQCSVCGSADIEKTISMFAAKTETTLDHRLRQHQEQAIKDNQRFHKDDTFAANILGTDDPGSAARRAKAEKEMQEKNERARQSIKRLSGEEQK